MSHVETLIMNTVREALEYLQRSGVGYIDSEYTGTVRYQVDNKLIRVSVAVEREQMGE